jgi:hypothetical protein
MPMPGETAVMAQIRRLSIEWALSHDRFKETDLGELWFLRAWLMLLLLVNRCDMPDGVVTEWDPAEVSRTLGFTDDQVAEALEVLTACDLAYELGSPHSPEVRHIVQLPDWMCTPTRDRTPPLADEAPVPPGEGKGAPGGT